MTQHSLSCLPIIYNPPEWVSTPGHPDWTWHLATSSQRHSWLCTDEQHKDRGWGQKLIFQINDFCGNTRCVCKSLLHFHPAVLRWFSSAQTQRRRGLWCRRSPCQSQLCSLPHKTSSASPPKHWRNRRSRWKRCIPFCVWMGAYTHTKRKHTHAV